jgi:hypothetical protein
MLKSFRLVLVLFALQACTASRWQVESEKAIDPKSGKIQEINTAVKLDRIQTGRNATLEFKLSEVRKTLYDQKIQSRRFVQQYTPRWTWFFLGFGASGLMYYMANAVDHGTKESNDQASILYNSLATATFIATLYNQKPVGEPRKTDEIKFLAKTGEIIRNDTVKIAASQTEKIRINVYFRDQVWIRNYDIEIKSDRFQIPIYDLISTTFIQGEGSEEIILDMEYKDDFFEFFIPIQQFMQHYARVKSPTFVMSKPSTSRRDQITNSQKGTIYPLLTSELGEWNTVSFGAATAFISKKNSELVWARPGTDPERFVEKSANSGMISALLESNIPLEVRKPQNPVALLIHNRLQSEQLTTDDPRALKGFLIQTFGYEDETVIIKQNLRYSDFLTIVQQFADSGPHAEVTLYLSAKWSNKQKGFIEFSRRDGEQEIALHQFFDDLSKTRGIQFRVFFDLQTDGSNAITVNELREMTGTFLRGMDRSFVWFSALPNQTTGAYNNTENEVGGNYSAFMYFVLNGIKQGFYQTADLRTYVERELNFYSRKVFERSQEPVYIGNGSINLIK